MTMLRELPFGARISDSFVKKLKWETAKANEVWPGASPCLCVQLVLRQENVRSMPSRIDFTNVAEILPINRLAPSPSPFVEITERVWMLNFENCQHPPETIFDIDGLGLHISKQTQAELKGATILVVSDTIVVEYWHS